MYLFFAVAFGNPVNGYHLVDGDELMGTDKKVWLKESEYEDIINKYPSIAPSVVREIVDGISNYSIVIKELIELQKRNGKEDIPDDCIEYVRSKKSNQSPYYDKNSSEKSAKKTQSQADSLKQGTLRISTATRDSSTVSNNGFEEALPVSASDEVSILARKTEAEPTNSLKSSIEHLSPKGVSEQQEITITQECVKSEQAISEISQTSSITQEALPVTNNTSQITLPTELKALETSETEPEEFTCKTTTQSDSEDQSLALAGSEKFTDIQETLTTWRWRRVFGAVVGSSHLRADPPVPCQDSALAVLVPRPAIFVADGAGSARLSHFGSSAVVRYLNRFTASIEDINQKILDQDRQQDIEIEKIYAYRFIRYTIEILQELSVEKKEPVDFFKCTLLIAIIGKNKLFWLKVGDGFIVIEKENNLELIGPLGKGDFANQTTFVTENLADKDIYYGFLDVQHVTAVAAFTDGAGEKLVSTNGLDISRALSKFFDNIRTGEFKQFDLHQFLSNKDVWRRTTGDDKGIAILSSLL